MTNLAKHSFLFRIWIRLRGLLAIIIIMFGVLVGLASLILPNEKLYKDFVVEFLAKQWGKKVRIDKISGKWNGFGPNFIIQGLQIKGDDEVFVQQASLYVNIFEYLIPKGSTGIILGINDIAVDFERKTSGKIVLTGESEKNKSVSSDIEKLLSSGTLSVQNLSLNLFDSIQQKTTEINSHITVQQNNAKRAFALEIDSQELAEKLIIKSVTDKRLDFLTQAKWYLQTQNLSLQYLGKLINKNYLPNSQVNSELWFSTSKGNIVELMAKAELFGNVINNKTDLSGTATLAYKGSDQNWNAELVLNDVKTQSISQEKIDIEIKRNDAFIYLKADVLDVSLLKAITQVINISNEEFDALLLDGKLNNVEIKYDVDLRRLVEARVQFQDINFDADFGKFTNLSGEISMYDDQINVLFDSDNGTAIMPDYIRGEVQWEKLLLSAQTSMQDDSLDFKINTMWCDCKDFILDGSARIGVDEGLFLDLAFAVYEAQANQLYKYWPIKKWKPNVLNFLDSALVSGVVKNGMILYHGQVADYPFNNNQGRFATYSNLVDATVKYHKDWPEVDRFDAIVTTLNRQLDVQSSKGTVLNTQIKNVYADINNLKLPHLSVDILASGLDNFLINILKNSPMKSGLNVLNQDILLKGEQEVTLNLEIPLKQPNAKVEPIGSIKFNNTDFQLGQFQLHDLNGVMDFVGFSMMLNQIQAMFLNQEVLLSGEILNKKDQLAVVNVLLNGNYNIENFESLLGFNINAQGISPWLFSISNKNSNEINFSAQSNLEGVTVDMPAPFNKPSETQSPFSITCTLPCTNSGWDISYDKTFTSHFNLDATTKQFKLNTLKFGENENNNDLIFGGELDVVDVDKWIELLASKNSLSSSNELPLDNMKVHINKLIFMSRELQNVAVKITNEKESINFDVNGDEVKGKIIIAKELDKKGIIVQLDKLHWLESVEESETQKVAKVSSNYPALHVWIGDFVYDGIPLGESSIEVRPVAEGIKVEKFNTESELMRLNINGNWYRDKGSNGTSKFNIIMTSVDIAQFLKKLGFDAPISEAQTIIDMQAQWPGFPSQFEIKNITGNMSIEVGEGEVVDAKPGMGRVLGLFSLTNLPRRLILDFKDVLGKGLHFNSMQGQFVLNNGEAYTDAFIIDSTSANIVVKGHTGLANQDYNQTVIVTPRVGRVLPTIGAIAGGAVGAAAGFIVQGMFSKGLKNVGKIIYKVTGSWDNPNIELIETKESVNEN
ncbi:MAG: YhdP family protein [Marinicellaceae bacterium]